MIDLCGEWRGASADGKYAFPAKVPGCVHTDLQAAGVLPADLFWRDNAEKALWIENEDWIYRRRFPVPRLETGAVLIFEGLDVYCRLFLNGRFLGEADDAFVPHRFPADGILREGDNEIEVRFFSAVARTKDLPERRHSFTGERLYTRRMQCSYGWDWAARFVTCGIFKPCRVEFENAPFVRDAYLYTRTLDAAGAEVVCDLEFGCFEAGFFYTLALRDETGKVILTRRAFCREAARREIFDLPDPHLWWPRGYGAQPLYRLTVSVGDREREFSFGVRTARVLQREDAPDSPERAFCRFLQSETGSGKAYDHNETTSSFALVVNGKPVFCLGADWVPCEPFLSEDTREKETRLLTLSAEAGVNMLRVWGGGVFASGHFNEECDRLGILTTQDFLMACGEYPEKEAWFAEALKKEAEFAARALRNHPSLVWWSGDNENAVRGSDLQEDYRGRTAAIRCIAPVLARLDPARTFLPSSPYGGDFYASKTVGTTHNTQFIRFLLRRLDDPGDRLSDLPEAWRALSARFIAEEPCFGAASTPSLLKMMTEEDVFFGKEMWEYHTRTNPDLPHTLFEYQCAAAEKFFGAFRDGADRLFKTQFLQYETVRLSLEQARRSRGFCTGVLFWMMADHWPAAAGWSLVDYYGLPKAGWYSFRRCAGELLASFEKTDAGFFLVLSNLSPEEKRVRAAVRRFSPDGSMTEDDPVVAAVPPRGEARIAVRAPEAGEWLTADLSGDASDRAFYKSGPLLLKNAGIRAKIEKGRVTLSADGYVHAVRLEGEAIFSDNWFSLLPGEEKTVTFTPAGAAVTVAAMTLETEKEE